MSVFLNMKILPTRKCQREGTGKLMFVESISLCRLTCASLTLAIFCALPASAQMIIQADSAALQAQIQRDDSGFSSCGVRAIVVVANSDFADAYDFSVVARDFAGTLKAGKTRTTMANLSKGKFSQNAVTPPPIKFWIAKEIEGKAITPKKIFPSETKGFILQIADVVQTFEGIYAIINGERMQFTLRYANQPSDAVISFSATLPEQEIKPLTACLLIRHS